MTQSQDTVPPGKFCFFLYWGFIMGVLSLNLKKMQKPQAGADYCLRFFNFPL